MATLFLLRADWNLDCSLHVFVMLVSCSSAASTSTDAASREQEQQLLVAAFLFLSPTVHSSRLFFFNTTMADTAPALPIAGCFLFGFFNNSESESDSDSDFDLDLLSYSDSIFHHFHHFLSIPSLKNTSFTMPRNLGYTNYSSTEVKSFLDVLEEQLPIGPDQWQEVADLHEQNGYNNRDPYSLRRKFNTLHKKTCPTGDPHMPEDVKQAKRIKYLIGDKANLIDASSPQFDLLSGGYGANVDEPTQEHLLGQPTQLTQTQDNGANAAADPPTNTAAPTATPTNAAVLTNAAVPTDTAAPTDLLTAAPTGPTATAAPTSPTATAPTARMTTVSPHPTAPHPTAPHLTTPSPSLKRKWNRHSSSTNSDFLATYQASLLEAREERIAAREQREEERRAAREERNADRKEAREFFMQAMQAWMAVNNNPRKQRRRRNRDDDDDKDDDE